MPPIRRSAYLLALLTLGAVLLSLVWRPAPPTAFVGVTSADVPTTIGGWVSQGDYRIAPEVRVALSSADIVSRTYAARDAASTDTLLDFVLIGGTDRNALHDPRSCLVGGGWRMDNDHVEPLPGTGADARACEAIGPPGGSNVDIVYLYVVDGRIRNAVTQIRAEMLASALLGRRNRPVYFLRVLCPLAADPTTRARNHERLVAFATAAWTALAGKLGVGGKT